MLLNRIALIVVLLTLTGCATDTAKSLANQPRQIQATQDFVAAAKLGEVSVIRLQGRLSFDVVNKRFVTVPGRGGNYLVEFYRDCRSLVDNALGPGFDKRGSNSANLNNLRAGSDTIRGCRIANIYEITAAQQVELLALNDKATETDN